MPAELARDLTDIWRGFVAPLLVPAHVMLVVALGLAIGQQKPRHRLAHLALFAAAILLALAAIVRPVAVVQAGLAVLAVAALMGAIAAWARPVPLLAMTPFTALGGAAIELDSVPDEISMRVSLMMLIGSAAGAVVVVGLVATAASRLAAHWQRIGLRIIGSWIAASAILVLALRLARLQL